MQSRQISKNGYSLWYYTQGNPINPALVFLHPAFGDHTCFHHQIEPFAADYHIIALDMLGHGKSQVQSGNTTIDKTVDLLAEVLQNEGHDQAHLVGVSLGSLIAQAFAFRFPQMAKTLTVVGGYSIFGDNSAILKAQRGEMLKWLFMVLFSMDRFRRYVVSTTNVVDAEREVFYRAMQHFTRRSFRVMPGMQKLLDKAERSLPQPLLIMVGEYDLPVVFDYARAWHARQPLTELRVILKAGHCANMDNPQEFNRTLSQFLQKVR
ncbi:MAG: alpha/beta hydrolase [Anaerolineales bacterium]|nr:alpha/beta hydrolase [Anaerolineales bacterium]